jgi:hypothetical protein
VPSPLLREPCVFEVMTRDDLLREGAPIIAAERKRGTSSRPAGPFMLYCAQKRRERRAVRGTISLAEQQTEVRELAAGRLSVSTDAMFCVSVLPRLSI